MSKIPAAEESVTTQVWRIVKAMGNGTEFGSKQLHLSHSHLPFPALTAALSALGKLGIIKAVGKGEGKEIVWRVTSKGAKMAVRPRRRPTPYKRKPKNGVPPIVASEHEFAPGQTMRITGEPGTFEVKDVGTMQDGKIQWQRPWHGLTERAGTLPESVQRTAPPIGKQIVTEILDKLGELEALTQLPPLSRFSTRELLTEIGRRAALGQVETGQ